MSEVRRTSSANTARPVQPAAGRARSVPPSPRGAAPGDSAGISGRAIELARVNAAVREVNDVRQGRIEALRAAIQEGTYRPDPSEIARKILERGL